MTIRSASIATLWHGLSDFFFVEGPLQSTMAGSVLILQEGRCSFMCFCGGVL
jgi:hypothetical protein